MQAEEDRAFLEVNSMGQHIELEPLPPLIDVEQSSHQSKQKENDQPELMELSINDEYGNTHQRYALSSRYGEAMLMVTQEAITLVQSIKSRNRREKDKWYITANLLSAFMTFCTHIESTAKMNEHSKRKW